MQKARLMANPPRAYRSTLPIKRADQGEQTARRRVVNFDFALEAVTQDLTALIVQAAAPHIDRLNLGAWPTNRVKWDQPHEGNLFEFLYKRRSIHIAALAHV